MKNEHMYVRETYTLLVNFSHNMDPKQIIKLVKNDLLIYFFSHQCFLRGWETFTLPQGKAIESTC